MIIVHRLYETWKKIEFFTFSSDPYFDFKSKDDIPYVLYGWYKCICMADNAEETKL